MNVLAIGAHPDDIEIGAGGAIALHRMRGDAVTFLLLTSGSEIADSERRKQEATAAADVLGVEDVRFLGFQDTQVPYGSEAVKRIESHVQETEPDRIYIHTEEDTHQDHRKSSLGAIAATRNSNEVLAYESPSTRSSFAPQYFVPFTESVLEKKIEAIETHESQSTKQYLEADAMRGLARFRGQQASSKYAESFQVIRIVDKLDESVELPQFQESRVERH
ncbi:PIG-L deacetylase family protein [Haloterrigena alkaliphila]|uniref:PIG-L family deacetylase n=1 Tax=Haloterrigena alkaliphila TaxID=2816475 RepID=A0A8A2VDB6_9EURY|nr:PIG-L deacetylase family protein [Haloterrigena alkaliphila]QSX00030.1 PIG-L family deacetylase [Haloterrigena alkaliphila]